MDIIIFKIITFKDHTIILKESFWRIMLPFPRKTVIFKDNIIILKNNVFIAKYIIISRLTSCFHVQKIIVFKKNTIIFMDNVIFITLKHNITIFKDATVILNDHTIIVKVYIITWFSMITLSFSITLSFQR